MNARFYDPAVGQFVSPDTLAPDAANLFDYNRYMYVRGNPLKYTDPSGHQASCAMARDGSISCDPNSTIGITTLTVNLENIVTPELPSQPAPPPTRNASPPRISAVTPTHTPTPTQGPKLRASSPLSPTPTPPKLGELNQSDLYWTAAMAIFDEIPEAFGNTGLVRAAGRSIGQFNQSDLYWTAAMAIFDEIPEAFGNTGLVRAAGRSIGQFMPIVGFGASVGPNLVSHLLSRDSLPLTAADLATDSVGFGASLLGGKVGGAVGGVIVTAIQPEAGPASMIAGGAMGSIVGGASTSIGWDLFIAPGFSNWLQDIWDSVVNVQ